MDALEILRFVLFGILSIAHMALILVYSILLAPPQIPGMPGGLVSFLSHFTAYLVLAGLIYKTLVWSPWDLSPRLILGLALLWVIFYSTGIEFLQLFVPSRSFEFWDIVANIVGAGTGAIIMNRTKAR